MALFYVGAGINHFVRPELYLRMMPPYLPLHEEAVLVSGVAEVMLGVALLIPRLRSLAAWGVIALLIAIFPANLHMALSSIPVDPDGPPTPSWALWARLPFQAVLIGWAYLYARGGRAGDEVSGSASSARG